MKIVSGRISSRERERRDAEKKLERCKFIVNSSEVCQMKLIMKRLGAGSRRVLYDQVVVNTALTEL